MAIRWEEDNVGTMQDFVFFQITDKSWTVGATTTPEPTGPTTEPGTTIPSIVSVTESNRGSQSNLMIEQSPS